MAKKKGARDFIKRSRASKPKVTTGCMVCKARHVKCDEQKPSCHRCKSSGRSCDWTPSLKLQPTREIRIISLGVKELPGSTEEIAYFQFFSTQTIPQLSGLFGYTFWNQDVLHACVSHPAMWHAAVAVASLQRERGSSIARKSVDEGTPSRFTLRQYAIAMRLMRESILGCQAPATDTTLICCLLLICFESLRGHYSEAIVHLDFGLRLLSEIETDFPTNGARSGFRPTPRTTFASTDTLALVFIRLDTQASQLLSHRTMNLDPRLKLLKFRNLHQIPTVFTSLEETRSISDQVWNFCMQSLQATSEHTPTSTKDSLAANLQICTARFGQVSKAFRSFMEQLGDKLDTRGQQGANAMRICHLVASIGLNPDYQKDIDDEEVLGNYLKEFSEIVCLATSIVDSPADEALGSDALRFTLDSCVLGPLYFVAMRCRQHKILRRKAIALLRLSRRLEGLLDSSLLAEIAERVMEIEETHEAKYSIIWHIRPGVVPQLLPELIASEPRP